MSSAPRVKPSPEEVAAQRKAKQAEKAAAKQAAGERKQAKQANPSSNQSSNQLSSAAPAQSHTPRPSISAASTSSASPGAPSVNPSGSQSASNTPSASQPAKHVKETSSRPQLQYDNEKKKKKYERQGILTRTAVAKSKQLPLFSHLPQYERETELAVKVGFLNTDLPAPILRLGLAYSHGSITGANARCVAMLLAFKEVIAAYEMPANKLLRDDLLQRLKPWVRFLSDCRPLSVSMGNAIRFFKLKIARLPVNATESESKEELIAEIDSFIQARIVLADQVIVASGAARINDGDTVLTYATSHVVESILLRARELGKSFRVIVVDSRPNNPLSEACKLLGRLVAAGINCTYVLLTSISTVIAQASLVFMGAYAMLSNGSCVSRAGSAIIAMMAHTYNVPVLVACEVYKFAERVQLDAICSNEIGDPDDLIANAGPAMRRNPDSKNAVDLSGWRDSTHLKVLNLVYDLTPVEFVTMVVTEVGNVPPTSVPVILREYHVDVDVTDPIE